MTITQWIKSLAHELNDIIDVSSILGSDSADSDTVD